MIDFHSHIVPNVDDGSKSIEETFKMFEEAEKAGFKAIVSTSHYIENSYESSAEERKIWISALQDGLNKKNINIKLYLGNEVYFTENIVKLLKSGLVASINNTNYVLFEFPLNTKPMNIYDVIYEMMGNGYIPILAHPERYSFVQKDPELIFDLIDAGVLMQANYGSILGRYGEKAKIIVKKFFENNYIHFLGSDVHKPETVYPTVKDAINEIKAIVGKEKIEELTMFNPALVLQNKKIEIEEPEPFKLSLAEKMKLNFK